MAVPTASPVRVLETTALDHAPGESEATVFCPGCAAFETVWFLNGALMTTRKFVQVDGRIYHDCGTSRPCWLYRPR